MSEKNQVLPEHIHEHTLGSSNVVPRMRIEEERAHFSEWIVDGLPFEKHTRMAEHAAKTEAAWSAWQGRAALRDWLYAELANVKAERDKLRAALATYTAQAAEAPDAWRQAVDRELTAIGQTVDIYAGPEGALRALIDWHCAVQIDPAVSSAAAELVERGRREAAQAVRQGPVALTCDQAATALRMALQDMRAIKSDVVESASLVGYFRNRLKELASAAPQASQPVARVRFDSGEVHIVPLVRHVEASPLKDGQTLYDSPQPPQPVALTDEQFAASLPDEVARSYTPEQLDFLEQGFRHAERAHGITPTEQQEQPR